MVAFKYAGNFYGVEKIIADRFREKFIPTERLIPTGREYSFEDTHGCITAPRALIVKARELSEFDYDDIKKFSMDVLRILDPLAPNIKHLAMTIHGRHLFPDEIRLVRSQLDGIREALSKGEVPLFLNKITIVEADPECVQRLQIGLEPYLKLFGKMLPERWGFRLSFEDSRVSDHGET